MKVEIERSRNKMRCSTRWVLFDINVSCWWYLTRFFPWKPFPLGVKFNAGQHYYRTIFLLILLIIIHIIHTTSPSSSESPEYERLLNSMSTGGLFGRLVISFFSGPRFEIFLWRPENRNYKLNDGNQGDVFKHRILGDDHVETILNSTLDGGNQQDFRWWGYGNDSLLMMEIEGDDNMGAVHTDWQWKKEYLKKENSRW